MHIVAGGKPDLLEFLPQVSSRQSTARTAILMDLSHHLLLYSQLPLRSYSSCK